MSAPTVYLSGCPVPLGKRLGRGGEGEVFAVDDGSCRALKYYTSGDTSLRERKIVAMVRSKLAERSSLVAFPVEVARHRDGRFAGFLMRMVDGHRPLHELYAPKARKQNFPKADYRFLIRAAANIARAVASVHEAGCVIGDINHSGILISDRALAALIDADSFQLVDGKERHLCLVGVPEYTPPELQGKPLEGIVRTPDHDAFGLAIVIFQLLFMGRHPFMGRYTRGEMPIERAIAEHRFAYSRQRNVGMTLPPGICTLAEFPDEIGMAFETAFSADRKQRRPPPAEWVGILEKLEHSLHRCRQNELHYFPAAAPACPWCKLENEAGLILFVPHLPDIGTGAPGLDPGAASFNLAAIWAAIDSVRVPAPGSIHPQLAELKVEPSNQVLKVISESRKKRLFAAGAMVIALAVLLGAPALWPVWLGLGGYAFVAFSGASSGAADFSRRYVSAHQQWDTALRDWQKRCGLDEVVALKEALRSAKAAYEKLPAEEQRRLTEYQQNRRRLQLEAYLDRYLIRRAKIRGIGPAKKAALASYGIETAEDVKLQAVLRVPGFGPSTAQALLEWRRRLEARFVYDDRPNAVDQQEKGKIRVELAAKGSDLRRKLVAGARDLRNAVAALEARAKGRDPVLTRLEFEKRQAKLDLEHLRLPVPAVPALRAGLPRANASFVPKRGGSASSSLVPDCPRCGSRMVKRTARRGSNRGNQFWGCSRYPVCTGTRSRIP